MVMKKHFVNITFFSQKVFYFHYFLEVNHFKSDDSCSWGQIASIIISSTYFNTVKFSVEIKLGFSCCCFDVLRNVFVKTQFFFAGCVTITTLVTSTLINFVF